MYPVRRSDVSVFHSLISYHNPPLRNVSARSAIGDFCTDDIDCHQFRPENATEAPPLQCFLTECICSAQNGYVPLNRYCVKRSKYRRLTLLNYCGPLAGVAYTRTRTDAGGATVTTYPSCGVHAREKCTRSQLICHLAHFDDRTHTQSNLNIPNHSVHAT